MELTLRIDSDNLNRQTLAELLNLSQTENTHLLEEIKKLACEVYNRDDLLTDIRSELSGLRELEESNADLKKQLEDLKKENQDLLKRGLFFSVIPLAPWVVRHIPGRVGKPIKNPRKYHLFWVGLMVT